MLDDLSHFYSDLCLILTTIKDNRDIYHSYVLPLGPTGLPLLGNLALLDPGAPYETLASLVAKYGKVLGLEITW